MPKPITSDQIVSVKIADVLADLAAASTLRLFKNDITPTSANVLADFTEADFAGYAGADLSALWGAPFRVQFGEWQFNSSPVGFAATAGSQVIHGWYLTSGATLWFSRRFDTPFVISPANPLALIIKPQAWALNLLLP